MRIRKLESIPPSFHRGLFHLIPPGYGCTVWAQAQNWWVLPSNGAVEREQAWKSSLKKVFLNVTFETSGPGGSRHVGAGRHPKNVSGI
jgi:hypothetical protein